MKIFLYEHSNLGNLDKISLTKQSRSQSLCCPWPAVGKQQLWEQPFQACAIDADCAVKPDGQNSVISFVISKWLLPEFSFSDLTAGQGERRLWEWDCWQNGFANFHHSSIIFVLFFNFSEWIRLSTTYVTHFGCFLNFIPVNWAETIPHERTTKFIPVSLQNRQIRGAIVIQERARTSAIARIHLSACSAGYIPVNPSQPTYWAHTEEFLDHSVLQHLPGCLNGGFQALHIPRGRYLRNLWVGMCRWDPGTLSLYQR